MAWQRKSNSISNQKPLGEGKKRKKKEKGKGYRFMEHILIVVSNLPADQISLS